MNQWEAERWREPDRTPPQKPKELRDVEEQLHSVKILVGELERHLTAGAIVKANSDAADLEIASKRLFGLTYKLAFPKG